MRKDFCDRVISEGEKTNGAHGPALQPNVHATKPSTLLSRTSRTTSRIVDEPRTQRASTPLDLMARALTDGGMMKAAAEAENDEFGTAASCLSRE